MARTRKRYSEPTKLSAVMAAEMTGVTATERATGIPKETIHYWMQRPEFAQYRTKVREDLKDEITVVAHLAWQRVGEYLHNGTLEPRDALFAAEKATVQYLLMSGEATTRSESTTLTEDMNDHERAALRRILYDALDRPAGADSTSDSVGDRAAVR